MQVDSTNFIEQLPTLLKVIEMADFVAFDCEFTGLVTQLSKIESFFPNHIEFYERIKETACNFRILQLGIAAFIYDKQTNLYVPKVYNFHVLPNTHAQGFNNLVICEVESMEFLAKNQLNFSRIFKNGIKTKRISQSGQSPPEHEYNNFLSGSADNMFLCPEEQQIVDIIEPQLHDLQINLKEAEVPVTDKMDQQKSNHNKNLHRPEKSIDFHCKNVLNYLKYKYPSMSISDPKKKIQDKPFQYVVRLRKDWISHEKMENEVVINNEQECSLEIIMKAIIEHKKPIIGHFPNLDIGLIYQTFISELPQTYDQFCSQINQTFPFIFDTKILSRRIQKKIKGIKVDLSSLFRSCFNSKLLQKYANINMNDQQISEYLKKQQHHEAGYDALMTGTAFVGMANFMAGTVTSINFNFIQCENKLLYSRFSGEVSINGDCFCSAARDYNDRIIIQSVLKKQLPQWKEIAQCFSQYGSLSVYEDHDEIYYVYEDKKDIKSIIEKHQPLIQQIAAKTELQFQSNKLQLKPYAQRRINKARKMYA